MTPSKLRGSFRALQFLLWTVLLVPLYFMCFPLGTRMRRPWVRLWHRGVCFITGMKVCFYGEPYKNKRVLLAGNHISYLDIPVLGSCFDITFVAKSDVASWPVFGFLARIAQTAFIERKPSKARQQKNDLKKRLMAGENLMIFPEGTSSDGTAVLPFKSALFEMAMEEDIREHCFIQPVTASFRRTAQGETLLPAQRDYFAWYGDMTLAPHLWHVFCLPGVQIDIFFHPPKAAATFQTRKEVAQWAEKTVDQGLTYLLSESAAADYTFEEALIESEQTIANAEEVIIS